MWAVLATPLIAAAVARSPAAVLSQSETSASSSTNSSTNCSTVRFNVTLSEGRTGTFDAVVSPDLAPIGAERFTDLVQNEFFTDVAYFRVIEGFVAQFGISGDPVVSAEWSSAVLADDPVLSSNYRGTISFASAGEGTRTTQLFINLVDNTYLDAMGFAPFATISEADMAIADLLYSGYGDDVSQSKLESEGNAYLIENFPLLSYINSATCV